MSVLLWIGGVVLVIVVAVFVLELLGDRPAYYRRKPVSFLADMVAMLAAQPEGSVLIMDHVGSDRFLQFRKPADTGRREQEVVFGFPDVRWTEPFFDAVVKQVERAGAAHEIVTREQGGEVTRFLEVKLEGDRLSLGREAVWLIKPLLPILGFEDGDRFTFHAERPHWDPELEARVQVDFWRSAARTAPAKWARRYAEWKVRQGQPKRD